MIRSPSSSVAPAGTGIGDARAFPRRDATTSMSIQKRRGDGKGGGGKRRKEEEREREEEEEEEEEEEGLDSEASDDSDDGESESASEDGESASEDGESESEELELTLAEDGRVACPILPHLRLDAFRSFPTLLPTGLQPAAVSPGEGASAGASLMLDRLVSDCRSVFTARAASRSQYSSGETFWLGADATPRCALERLARRIFDLHTAPASEAWRATRGEKVKDKGKDADPDPYPLPFDPATSGAEWWTQVLDPRDEIGLHWDKDYGLEGSNLNVHPHVGTVTYLCHGGAPTLIVRKDTPVFYSESVDGPLGASLAPEGGHGGGGIVNGDANAFVSWPAVGKHVAFDGRWLHGAPTELAAAGEDADNHPRVTFLVNVWLNHVPSTATPLPDDVAGALSSDLLPGEVEGAAGMEEGAVERVEVIEKDKGRLRWTFKHGGGKSRYALEVDVPGAWAEGGGLGGGRSAAVVGGGGCVSKAPKKGAAQQS